ncbi:MAG: hypothetical protein KIG60_01240 [Caryophanon sp.]|nr:hypothetical protein [Caryophanon sp.]
MSGPNFGFKWNPVNADIDWQLTQSKSYGDGIQTLNNAMNAFADSTRKQNTDALLMQIAQANDPTALGNTGILAGIDPLNRTVAGADVLKEFMTRDDALRTKQANTMATDFLLNNTTNLEFIKERSELEGITPEYMGPIASLVSQQRATAAAAAQQAEENKRKNIEVGLKVSKNNSDVELNNFNMQKSMYENQGKEETVIMYDENGKAYPVTTRTPSLAQVAGGGVKTNIAEPQAKAIGNLRATGWNDNVVSGFVGNFMQEGGWDGAKGDGGSAHGVAQWRGERLTNYKKIIGKSPTESTIDEQMKFVQWEMENPQAAGMTVKQRDMILAAKTPEEAAELIDKYYERSDGKSVGKRQSHAKNVHSHISGSGGAIDAAVKGNTSGEVANPVSPGSVAVPSSATTKGAKGQPPKFLPGVGFDGPTVLEAQASMKAALEAANAKNTIAKAKPSKVQESEFQQFLAKGGYTGNEIFNRNAELYGTLKNFGEFNNMPGSEKKALMEYLTNENQKGWGLAGRMSAEEVKAKVERYKSDRKFDAAATAKQEAFTALNVAATKLYHANVGRFPNITMQQAREMVDKQIATEYANLNKDKKGS